MSSTCDPACGSEQGYDPSVFMGGWEDGSRAAFVLHHGLQEAVTIDLFSHLSADGDSGGGTFSASGACSHIIRCCCEGGMDNLVRGVFAGS